MGHAKELIGGALAIGAGVYAVGAVAVIGLGWLAKARHWIK